MNKKVLGIVSLATVIAPFMANAQGQTVGSLINTITSYLNDAIYLMIAFATVMFVFYVVKYFMVPSDGEKRKEAGNYVMYSVIGFFIILSFWGLVNIVRNTFGIYGSAPSDIQSIFPASSGSGNSRTLINYNTNVGGR